MRQSFSSRASLPLRVLARLSRFLGRTGSVTRSSRRDRRRSGRFRGAHRSGAFSCRERQTITGGRRPALSLPSSAPDHHVTSTADRAHPAASRKFDIIGGPPVASVVPVACVTELSANHVAAIVSAMSFGVPPSMLHRLASAAAAFAPLKRVPATCRSCAESSASQYLARTASTPSRRRRRFCGLPPFSQRHRANGRQSTPCAPCVAGARRMLGPLGSTIEIPIVRATNTPGEFS